MKQVIEDSNIDSLTFDDRGLIPAIAQDISNGAVLMLAWADREAIEQTLKTAKAHFWSRSRQQLWCKGETSGNVLSVEAVLTDCDRDSLLYRVHASGPACHRGTRSCFEPNEAELELGWLYDVLRQRRDAADVDASYTARLFAAGRPRIAQKVAEEAAETVIASLTLDNEKGGKDQGGDPVGDPVGDLVGEASDLLYHLMVLLLDCGVEPKEIAQRLADRHTPGGK